MGICRQSGHCAANEARRLGSTPPHCGGLWIVERITPGGLGDAEPFEDRLRPHEAGGNGYSRYAGLAHIVRQAEDEPLQ